MNWLIPEFGGRNNRQSSKLCQGVSMNPVLQVNNLQVSYYTDAGRARALDGVSLTLDVGEKLGLVGESGSGKSTMALAMMRMIKPPGRIEGGQIIVGDCDLTALSEGGG